MRYLAVLMVAVAGLSMVLAGCDDPVEPRELGPYEVTTLRTLPEGTDATFGDLNENGQALWHEGEQAILWDNGAVLEVPVGKFLGSSGEVLGNSSVWIDGELTELPGLTRGITEDGTVYFSRNDTMFTWQGGSLTETDRPVGSLVGPEGRIWQVHLFLDNENLHSTVEIGFHFDGEWHLVVGGESGGILMVEENGWALANGSLAGTVGAGSYAVIGPVVYQVLDSFPHDIAHINSQGHAIAPAGIVAKPNGERVDLREHLNGSIRLGAINDDGEILAQLDDEIVLLTPR